MKVANAHATITLDATQANEELDAIESRLNNLSMRGRFFSEADLLDIIEGFGYKLDSQARGQEWRIDDWKHRTEMAERRLESCQARLRIVLTALLIVTLINLVPIVIAIWEGFS